MTFIHLNVHSNYSILTGIAKPKDIVKKALDLGMNSVALTDLYNIHGCHEFYKEAKAVGINPILGSEILVTNNSISDTSIENMPHNLVLLAKNLKGYRNLLEIITYSNLKGFYKKPRIDKETLKKYSEDLICISGPISSEIAYNILCGKSDENILDVIKSYIEIFGKENYYLQLAYHDDIPKQRLVTDRVIEIGQKYDIPMVATSYVYYINKDDRQTQDVVMCLNTGHITDNPDRPTMVNGDYSMLGENEIFSLFGHIPGVIENTQKIADKVNIQIETGGILIPKYDLPDEDRFIYEESLDLEKEESGIQKLTSDEWYLRYLCFKGLNWRYGYEIDKDTIFEFVKKLDKKGLVNKLQETSPEELKDLSITYYTDKKNKILSNMDKDIQEKIERLEYELVVVHEMGFDAYFLIVADYINWAREQDIPVGPGRGSAAGALLAYLSGITDIDPLKYDLLFERFLNPARVSMPDIDTDFSDDARDRVIDYCRQKYGSDHVAQICTFGTFAARAAVKDVGRTKGIEFSEMNKLASLIPEKPGTKLKGALEDSIEFKMAYDDNEIYRDIIDNALKIEGNVRQLGVHACAVIIAPEKMTNFTALQYPPKDDSSIITQYSAYPLEDLGLLKMDFLGLRNLTIIQRCQKIIKNSKGIYIDVLKIPMDDMGAFGVFSEGDTTGVFQFESDGMRKYLKDLKPNTFNDIIAMVSLYRPGPLAYIPTYIDRKYGREEIKYMTDSLIIILKDNYSEEEIEDQRIKLESDLRKILDVSYGIAVYQEQLMFIVQYMAGFSLGEADLLRRGVGKKKIDVIEKLKIEFIEKSKNYRGYFPEVSKYIYEEMIQPAANYSFNKSHAACYALIAYQTAYLKAYYPTEFLTSVMVSDEENMERITLEVGEAKTKGINILAPDINESMKHFTYIDDKNIRFGLKAVKGLGDGPIDAILKGRELGKYVSLEDFIKRGGREVINKKSLEALILSGAMDSLGERGELFGNIDEISRYYKTLDKNESSDQMGFFDLDIGSELKDSLKLKKIKPFDFEKKIKGEEEMLGIMVSGHPLDGMDRYIEKRSNNTRYLKMSFEELSKIPQFELKKGGEEEKKQQDSKEKDIIVSSVGYITEVRDIVTKTGRKMLIFKVESFEYDFEGIIFSRDYEKYIENISEGKFVIMNGIFDCNLEYKRKSIRVRDAKFASIGQLRSQAVELGIFTKNLFNKFLQKTSDVSEEKKEDDVVIKAKQASELFIEDNSLYNDNTILEYIVIIPLGAKKEDLHELKSFLQTQESGGIHIYIDLYGRKIDTKAGLLSIDNLKSWEKDKWK